jgi:putative selenate reductase
MSDKLYILPIEHLFKRMLAEEKSGQLFGIPRELFFIPDQKDVFRMERYDNLLETPLGVAAGPHTQMTQNIISAWLTGSRYIELKTVQTLDELDVSKPCIDMEDEGYNCEWSQELKLMQSYDQYLNAWILIHLLRHKWGWQHHHNGPGFIFNLSVGYNMEGILKPNVQEFLAKMANCKVEKETKIARLSKLYPAIKDIEIPDNMSDNITLSTMHGCPPDEIEKIGRYLIEERGYHTTIKMNPTLLGPEGLRDILNHRLGFHTTVPDEAFEHDLKYDDALNLIRALQLTADKKGVQFSLKLTNTLESINHRNVFPKKEKMMYMSGKPLHPISVNVAAKLQESFAGQLDISFSAGVDCFNIQHIIGCGIKPVTVCSDLLKPGGYARMPQYLDQLETAIQEQDAVTIDQFILKSHEGPETDVKSAALENLDRYACSVLDEERYHKDFFPGKAIKTHRPLEFFDCIEAPCVTTCPAHQGIPDYMYYTAQGDYQKALDVILKTNPFPTVTGMVCDHVCTGYCTRNNYDAPLQIRDIKRFIAEQAKEETPLKPAPATGLKVAIIGAGPSGLACAFYLALQGVKVTLYEANNVPGGQVSATIPTFRLREEDLRKDIERIEQLGVTIVYNHKIDKETFKKLRESNDFVYIAVGAQTATRLNIAGEKTPGTDPNTLAPVTDALSFLARVKQDDSLNLGKRVAIIGGGNSAVDAARTAWRLVKGKDSEVVMLYRRTRSEMPADPEEIEELLSEGIRIKELISPVKITHQKEGLDLTCWKMQLGEMDDSGRRRPIKIEGSDFHLHFDTIISAIGQQVVMDFLDEPMTPDPATLKMKGKTAIHNVLIGGDALHGPFNIITAIADGKRAADRILKVTAPIAYRDIERDMSIADYQQQSAWRVYGEEPLELALDKRRNFNLVTQTMTEEAARQEAARCLLCSDVCNVCVTVCPNRANISYTIEPVRFDLQKAVRQNGEIVFVASEPINIDQAYQVLNIADFCNECGNCATFCPTGGAPYKDKPKRCLTEESFNHEAPAFFIHTKEGNDCISWKQFDDTGVHLETLTLADGVYYYETETALLTLEQESLRIKAAEFKDPGLMEVELKQAAWMSVLLNA